jgi:hypothetical protein
MRNNLRKLVVNNNIYKWKIDFNGDGDGGRFLKIWDSNKKER